MARKRLQDPEVTAPEPGFRPSVHELETRQLMTLDWDGKTPLDAVLTPEGLVLRTGAIVRVRPHSDVTDAQETEFRAALFKAGAAVVRFLPRRKGVLLPMAERARTAHQDARAVVRQLVAESFVEDRAKLEAFCDGIMDRVKL